ncbi:suppressor of tub2 mutation, partial [Rhizopus stolonifer]
IITRKSIEKEFLTVPSIFSGEETGSNWKIRYASITRLRGMLQCNGILLLRIYFAIYLSKAIDDIVQTMFSLRENLALNCLEFVAEVGELLGPQLHPDTAEPIIASLVKCCSTLKKSLFIKANEVAISFLKKVCFSSKIVAILCKTIDDKSNQVRQSAAEFLMIFLKIHARNFQGKSADRLQGYIKRGLADASPEVRESCRQAYWVYYEHWPKEAEKICLEMDSDTLQQLKAAKKKEALFPTVPQKDATKKNSRKATEELRPEEEMKKRRVSVKLEKASDATRKSEKKAKKEYAFEKTYNPTLDNLNQVARLSLDSVKKGTEMMKANKLDPSLLLDLQTVSENTPLLDIHNVDADSTFWLCDLERPFLCCLEEVTNLIDGAATSPFVKHDAVCLASSLIRHQKALFLRFKKPIVNKQASYLYPLVRALFSAHAFPSAKKAVNDLLAIYPSD